MSEAVRLLQEARHRERAQSLFYQVLAGAAQAAEDTAAADRLNALLADEQHHVSRLTARLLELGQSPEAFGDSPAVPALVGWERAASAREADEVRWYADAVTREVDAETLVVLKGILESEVHHREELGGKWMPATPFKQEGES